MKVRRGGDLDWYDGSTKLINDFIASLPHHRPYTPHFPVSQDEFLHLIFAGLQSTTVASNLCLVRISYNSPNVYGPDHYRVCIFNTSTRRVMVNTPDF